MGNELRSWMDEIGETMRRQAPFAEVEEMIESYPTDLDNKAALWLYAWSLQSSTTQRVVALAYIGEVAGG